MLKEILSFNPDYCLKRDKDRIIIYSRTKEHSAPESWASFIHPIHAIVFSEFMGGNDKNEVIKIISNFFKKNQDQIQIFIESIIENKESVNIKWNGNPLTLPPMLLINELLEHPQHQEKYTFDNTNIYDADLKTRRLKESPLDIDFMITTKCRLRCKYCYADLRKDVKEISIETFAKFLEESKKLNLRSINVIGGDIFEKKDWSKYLKLMIKYGYMPKYLSTKKPITQELIDKLYETGYTNEIQISLDSLNENLLSEHLSIKEGYLTRVKQGIELLDNSIFTIRINTVITKYTKEEDVYEILKYLNERKNVKEWEIRNVLQSLYVSESEFSKLLPTETDKERMNNYIKAIMKDNTKFSIVFNESISASCSYSDYNGLLSENKRREYNCTANLNHLFLLPDGKVTICEQLYWHPKFIIGDINLNSIIDIWNSPNALQLEKLTQNEIQEGSKCKRCEGFSSCYPYKKRCWVDILKLHGKNNWSFPDKSCINVK